MILEKFEKQPGETKYFDVHFEDFLAALGTTATGVVATAPDGITQTNVASITNGVARVWASGGLDGASYKYEITVTCANGWVEQQEIVVKVKES